MTSSREPILIARDAIGWAVHPLNLPEQVWAVFFGESAAAQMVAIAAYPLRYRRCRFNLEVTYDE